MKKNYIVGGVILALILLGGVVALAYRSESVPDTTAVACSQEAMVCPDGSSVSRTGPNCTFASCPTNPAAATTTPTAQKETTTVALNETAYTFGVHLTPIEVVEDSRCPAGVNCIQAGTVRVRVKLQSDGGTQTTVLTLGSPTLFLGKRVVLMEATPLKTTKPIVSSDYRFTFRVGYGMAEAKGTLAGKVIISPVCPVEQVNNPCSATPEMYAAHKISVYTADKTKLLATITPGADGSFSLPIDVGTYYVKLANPQVGIGSVRGLPATVTINGGQTTHLQVDVDTGIR